MQDINYALIKIFSKYYRSERRKILEVGSYIVNGQEKFMDFRSFFKNSEYIGCDLREGKGVDIITNVEKLIFNDNTFDLVICLDTLEHVQNPIKASSELFRVIKDNGILILSSVMNFAIHKYPNDYWRFTPDSFELLTRNFDYKFIGYFGYLDFPQNIYAICLKGKQFNAFNDIFKNSLPSF